MANYDYDTGLNFTLSKFFSEADRFFDECVLKAKELVAFEGMTKIEAKNEVLRMVANSEGEFNSIFNRQGRIIRPLTLKIVDLPIRNIYNKRETELYYWVLGESAHHCRDCEKLSHLGPMTIKDWRKLGYGLPREGDTACGIGCNCLLSIKKA